MNLKFIRVPLSEYDPKIYMNYFFRINFDDREN